MEDAARACVKGDRDGFSTPVEEMASRENALFPHGHGGTNVSAFLLQRSECT